MHSQRVVIVTRTKNRPILLRRCIRSVLQQSYTDWLHVIVNDGGDPTSLHAIVSLFSEEYRGRLRLIHNPHSIGMQDASNIAIKATDSEFLVVHDDDDSWTATFLEVCMDHLDSLGPDAREQGIVCQTNRIMEEIDPLGTVIQLSRQDYQPFNVASLSLMARRNQFPPIAFFYRRSVHDKIGYFNQAFNELGDWDFNLRFLLHYDITVIPNRLANYHWRHQARGSGYGNTVTDAVESHHKMALRLRDYYLREDVLSGHRGLGFLLLAAGEIEDQRGAHYLQWHAAEHLKYLCESIAAKATHFELITADLTRLWRLKVILNVRGRAKRLRSLITPTRRPTRVRTLALGPTLALDHALQRASVVSLDVFDTVLHRLVRKPTDVFLFMEDDVRRLLSHPELRFPDVRISAEAVARGERRESGGGDETTLEEIYAVVARMAGCDKVTARQLLELELAAERTLCYANPDLLALIQEAARAGKKILFTSDMYLATDHVLSLLRQTGISGYDLHVSSAAGLTKHRGTLYDHVVRVARRPPGDILHIGDNPHSDYVQPRKRGIAAHNWVKTSRQIPLVDQLTSLSGAWDRDLASSVVVGLVRRRRLHKPLHSEGAALWEMIGYEVIGPLYLAYTSWVLERALAGHCRTVYFLSRDGFYPLRVFNMIRQRQGDSVHARYLLASRRLWNVADIAELDSDTMEFLITPNPAMRVRNFMERLGLDPERYQSESRRCGFDDIDLVVTTKDGEFLTPPHRAMLRDLMECLADPILEVATSERRVLLEYLRDQGLFDGDGAIVDLGWRGSSIRSLNSLLARASSGTRFKGLYFGTWKYAQASVDAGHDLESFYFDRGEPEFRASLIAESVELLESFFGAPCCTVVGLRKGPAGWEPVFGEAEVEPDFLPGLTLATDAALVFIEHYLEVVGRRKVAPPLAYLDAVVERLWRSPSKEEAELLGGVGLRNSFGGYGPIRYLAKIPPRRLGRRGQKGLQDAYDHSYWKKGFLAQLSAKDRRLLRV